MKNNDIIRYIYLCSNLTYSEMSSLTDIKIDTLANWITGRRNPPAYVVELIISKTKKYLSAESQQKIKGMLKTTNSL